MLRLASDHGLKILRDFSLEMTAKDISAVEAARELIPLRTPISITSLNRESVDSRVRAAAEIARLGFLPVPHISARQLSSGAELRTILDRFQTEAGVERFFIIAGDVPTGPGPFSNSLEIIESGELDGRSLGCVGIAGYPEGHPKIDEAALWSALKAKHSELTKRGYDIEIVTQFGFDVEPIFVWLKRLRSEGIKSVVRIGIAGPTNAATLLRFAARCGVGASTKVLSKYGLSAAKLLGTAGPDSFLLDLASRFDGAKYGDVKIHFYPFGGFGKTAAWLRDFVSDVPVYSTRDISLDVRARSARL